MVWVFYYVLPVVAGLGVLVLCAYRLFAESLVLKREVSAAVGRLSKAGEALMSGLEELRPADGGLEGVDDGGGEAGGDGPELAGRVAAWRDAAGVRGR
jgi:hypothetical protein